MTTVCRPAPPARRPRRCRRPACAARCRHRPQLQQLLRLLYALGGQHLRDAQLDLHEVVDGDRVRCAGAAGRGRCAGRARRCGGTGATGAAGPRRAVRAQARIGSVTAVSIASPGDGSISIRGQSWPFHKCPGRRCASGVAVESGCRRGADAAQDLPAQVGMHRRSSTAARRIASAASNRTRQPSAHAGSFASVQARGCRDELVRRVDQPNAAAAPSCSAKRSIAAR